jgi:NHLM bacteriocin system secretion protein
MSLSALVLLIASIVLWGFFGAISDSVGIAGMIVDPAGVATVTHTTSGRVTDLLVQPGSEVKKGDVVARIFSIELQDDTVSTRMGLYTSGNILEAYRNIADMGLSWSRRNRETKVVSEYDGIVTEVQVKTGDMVTAGTSPICRVRMAQSSHDLIGLFYIPAQSAKRVKQGMLVRISPSEADTDETGFLMGIVREISDYPASGEGMMKTLGNSYVVDWILNRTQGAASEVKVHLIQDEQSPSGYLWSSIIGDHPALSAGSACTGVIIVDRKAPIDKVFYNISQWLRDL